MVERDGPLVRPGGEEMKHELKRAAKFCAAWVLYGAGHVTSLAADKLYSLYGWLMVKSDYLDEGWIWEEWD